MKGWAQQTDVQIHVTGRLFTVMWSWTHALSPCPCSGCPLGFMCVYAVVIHHLPVSINVHTHTHKITTKHSQSGSCPQYNFSLHHQRTQLIKNNPPLSRILSLETGCNPNSLSLASSPPLSHSLTHAHTCPNKPTNSPASASPANQWRQKKVVPVASVLEYGCSTGQHQSSHYDAANWIFIGFLLFFGQFVFHQWLNGLIGRAQLTLKQMEYSFSNAATQELHSIK